MPTSDYSLTANSIITEALELIGVASAAEAISAEDAVSALRSLNIILKSPGFGGIRIWKTASASITLIADTASYAVSERPHDLVSMQYIDTNGREIPMLKLSRRTYDELPIKTSNGIPTQFHYDVGVTAGTLYVWPLLAAISGGTAEKVKWTGHVYVQDCDALTDVLNVPASYYEALSYVLAGRLADKFDVEDGKANRVKAEGAIRLTEARAQEDPGSVYFMAGDE